MPPLPKLGGAFINVPLPRTLVLLHLQDILISPEDFATVSLPLLAFARFVNCGPETAEAIETLVATCPKLERNGCVWSSGKMEPPVSAQGHKLAHAEVRQLARLIKFPCDDLAGLSLEGIMDVLERGY
jgi:hypothetical protein